MDDETPSWLPDLILFENYKGNWNAYINAVYQCFHKDFVESKPSFQKVPVFARYHPPYEEKGATFWHLVSEGSQESERIPDLRRCERIHWPRPMIENVNPEEVKIWETIRPWKNQKQRRVNFALNNFSYIVVIAETRKGFDLVTAYHLEKPHRREKLRKEFEAFLRQKKEGSAV
ncbi:MAG: hypothetical protein A3D96_04660 [Chlamydiae bacterium RIFCSPHIGHO2_12_FULL_44_59]|nr:MAG: hypothetical protein A2796_02140 [Chlamydiae bacterium RIFCSPHIGHO2_01_FULL_44_39]OGN59696.1 MAG: hypothetical protein A3D96_04660 [Chlamydiae bacterium RIFCSPHIGHO2_12_FULL_44_59]OGN65773.1 MAG: hypothetical protein A2978_05000 [Chlamydiae bacterium RIFCSPLOWO2_01_FULL_44_52]OGN67935.1 MAG: hypothetical protein A3I67_00660 [Chlamydiae bacterium RIFCSPLOWO2_02_FULL_45_22]OGN69486.1 MAG: hypothetical protein A3F79_06385 [Chlamydiae bacterium RIFCSPLOWO2_12_FULL_45_20]